MFTSVGDLSQVWPEYLGTQTQQITGTDLASKTEKAYMSDREAETKCIQSAIKRACQMMTLNQLYHH